MSNEIKEILENLRDSVENPTYEQRIFGSEDYETVDNDYCLIPNKCKVLLDYITNLQQENERYKKIFEGKISLWADNLTYYKDDELRMRSDCIVNKKINYCPMCGRKLTGDE